MPKFRDDRKRAPIRKSKTVTRTLIKKDAKKHEDAMLGFVTLVIGQKAYVKKFDKPIYDIDFSSETVSLDNEIFECIVGGAIVSQHDASTVVCVGDVVHFHSRGQENHGVVVKIEERKTDFSRKAIAKGPTEQAIASNISHLCVIMSTFDPPYNKRLIDRFMVAAEQGGLEMALCINKMDLFHEMEENVDFEFDEDFSVYKRLGVEIFYVSAATDEGMDELKRFLIGKRTVLTGPSGSGKSTIINRLIGADKQKTGDVSGKTGKGQHTTSFTRMFVLPEGGIFIDTPGIRELGITGMHKHDLSLYFHDFDEYAKECKYFECSHIHEPECGVIAAVEQGKIDEERYQSYINIYNTLEDPNDIY